MILPQATFEIRLQTALRRGQGGTQGVVDKIQLQATALLRVTQRIPFLAD